MKILYHIGDTIGFVTILKRGVICKDTRPMIIKGNDEKIVLNDIKSADFYKANLIGTTIKIQNGSKTIFMVVPRIFVDKGTGFVLVNYFATKKLKHTLDLEVGNKY